jgi:hypothetical protein
MFKHALAALSLAAIAACSPIQMGAERTDTVSRTLTVEEIDRDTRRITVSGDGERFVLRLGDAVVNFDQIEAGDTVNVEYVEFVAAAMADAVGLAGTSGDAGSVDLEDVVTAQPGQRPGMAGGQVTTRIVEFVAYDRSSQRVTLRTEDGNLFSTRIQPEMRRFAQTREPGDRIVITTSTGLAVSVTPTTGG